MLIPPVLDRYENTLRLQDHYEWARRVWTLYRFEYVEYNKRCIEPFACCLICGNWKDLREWLHWVNRNIVLNLGLDSKETIAVKLRIATGMLNKIKTLDSVQKIQIHSNLTRNIWYESYIIETEDLPFQL